MDIETLKMGDMFFSKKRDALIMVMQSNYGRKNTLVIIDSVYTYYLDPIRDKDSLEEWSTHLEELEKGSMRTAYANIKKAMTNE